MAVELQYLIDRIHREAIEKADLEAVRILAEAKERATAIVKEAEVTAMALLEQADRDATLYVERSTRTLEQAARDLLISVGQAFENMVQDIVGIATEQALDPETLKRMMVKLAQAYAEHNGAENRIEFLISPGDQKEITEFFADQYRHHLVSGVTISTDSRVIKGFRVVLKDERIYHDFTKSAIAESLSHFLRPHLAEIVHRTASEASADAER